MEVVNCRKDTQALTAALSTLSDAELDDLIASRPLDPRRNPADFRADLTIDVGGGEKRPFSRVIQPWQAGDFKAMDPAWVKLCYGGDSAPWTRAYLERARGHSKTLDIAIAVSWALWASPRKLRGIVASGDLEQAKLVRNAVDGLVRMNPWLGLSINNYELKNKATGSECVILSSDAATSYGETPDFVIVDELTHWKKRDLWVSVATSSAKRPDCVFLVISNAGSGLGTSWQWGVREMAVNSDAWYFHSIDGPQAPWITAETLREQENNPGITPKEFARLWLNIWQTETGDALDLKDVDACTQDWRMPADERPADIAVVIGGMDLSLTKDHTALVWLGLDPESERYRLLNCKWWRPQDFPSKKIQFDVVEEVALLWNRRYDCDVFVYDPWNAPQMIQNIERQGFRTADVAHKHEGNRQLMATRILHCFANQRAQLYPCPELRMDFAKLNVVQKSYGFALEATKDAIAGHADRAMAFAMALGYSYDVMRELRTGVVDFGDYTESIRA